MANVLDEVFLQGIKLIVQRYEVSTGDLVSDFSCQ